MRFRRKSRSDLEGDGSHEGNCAIYQIRVEGRFDPSWSEWFSGLEIALEVDRDRGTVTDLTGPVADQAALRGILSRMWDLNLIVISVRRLENTPDR